MLSDNIRRQNQSLVSLPRHITQQQQTPMAQAPVIQHFGMILMLACLQNALPVSAKSQRRG